jgi:hypothetical protein
VSRYGDLTLDQHNAVWTLDKVPPHVAIRLKHLFPRIPKTQTSPFCFPHDQMHCADLAWFLLRYPMRVSPRDEQVLTGGRLAFEATQAELERILTPDYQPGAFTGLRPGEVIRPYQAQAIDIAFRRKGLLVGDFGGAGKTYTAAGFFLKPGTLPAAVVVQTHLQRQWAQKLTSFTNLRVHLIKTTKPYSLPEADVYLFRYTQLAGWVDFFATDYFKAVAYDEIQELRTGAASAKGLAAIQLTEHTEYHLGLSATPIYGYGAEIWNIMRMIDPAVLGSREDFMREWTGGSHVVIDPEALGSFLREQHIFIRRMKADVGQQMPPVNKIVETVASDDSAIESIRAIARMLALKTISGSFAERGQAARELDMLARHATGVGKARNVAAYVRILLEADVPVILAGWHRDVYDIWLRELAEFKPAMYTGTESPTQKTESERRFKSGETNLFILSLRSGAGVDGLQERCSTVVFGELDWSGRVMEQIILRVDREGQTEPVTAIYLNSDDGSDPPMVDLIGLKASQQRGIIDPGSGLESVHSDHSRISLLAQQFLTRREFAGSDAHTAPPAARPDPKVEQREEAEQSALF